ncbi:MAG: lipoprotein insertase outer membrane protein LolB [Gammaproteobacteria bacterium]
MLGVVLTGCATTSVLEGMRYDRAKRLSFYALDPWEFEGRLALQSASGSETPGISWRHHGDEDKLRLFGPLGQGAVAIRIRGNHIEIDRGDGEVDVSDRPNELIEARVGFAVPLAALRYWVLGLPEAGQYYEADSEGFRQAGWVVHYPQWMYVQGREMPYKITVRNEGLKLKLVIDQWVLGRDDKTQ